MSKVAGITREGEKKSYQYMFFLFLLCSLPEDFDDEGCWDGMAFLSVK